MQSLCTLRDHCRQWPRNTRYQADATPYLGRTSTGWIAPALPGALIRSPRRRGRAASAALRGRAPSRLEVDAQLVLCRLHDWQIGGVRALKDTARIDADLTVRLGSSGTIAHQPAGLYGFGVRIGCRNAVARCEKHQLNPTRGKQGAAADEESVRPLIRERGKGDVDLASVARLKNSYLQAHCACCRFYLFQVPRSDLRVTRVNQHR